MSDFKFNPGQQRAWDNLYTSDKRFCLLYGGSRCVAGDTVLDGHTETIAAMARRGLPVMVRTSHGWQMAEAPFRKGADSLLRFKMDDGRSVEVTTDHRFWIGDNWVRAETLKVGDFLAVVPSSSRDLLASSWARNRQEYLAGDPRSSGRHQGYSVHCSEHPHLCDGQPHPAQGGDQASCASQSDASGHSRAYLRDAGRGSSNQTPRPLPRGATHSLDDLVSFRQPTMGDYASPYQQGEYVSLVSAQTCEPFPYPRQDDLQCQGPSGSQQSIALLERNDEGQCCDRDSLPCDTPNPEGYELSRITAITSTAIQDYYTLHVPGCEHYFANGILHHNSGKTFLAIYTILVRALKAPKSKHLIVRQEASSARASILRGNMATLPAVIRICFPGLTYEPNEKYGYITLPNGSEIWVGGLNDDKAMERILGNEYVTIYMNEASECRYSAFTLLRSRLAQVVKDVDGDEVRQRFLVDLNPTTRNHWTYRTWIDGVDPEGEAPLDMDQFGHEVINPFDNMENLSGDYLADLEALPDRARRRFLEGKYVEDVEQALWQRRMFRRVDQVPDLHRIVVAVDPAISNEAGSDETGIICCGIDRAGIGYLLADDSGKYRPEEWARRVVAVFDEYGADRVVGEVNQGGDMVESVIRAQRSNIPYTAVRATRGKAVRAEPVAALYERGKVFHVGRFDKLEDQMCSVTVDFDSKAQGWSPDRVDALVWGFTDLFPSMTRGSRNSDPIRRPIGTMA